MSHTFVFELRPVGEPSAPDRGGEGAETGAEKGARVVEFAPRAAHGVPSVKQHVVDVLLPDIETLGGTGVYTSARADLLPGELALHVDRLARSIRSSPGEERPDDLASRLLDMSHRNAMDVVRESGLDSGEGTPMIVVVFVCVNGSVQHAAVYISAIATPVPRLLAPPEKRRVAFVVGPPRPRPEIKDIAWIRDRRELESLAASAAGDVPDAVCCDALLSMEDGRLLEGTITNLFVIVATPGSATKTGLATSLRLQTAPDSMVLGGIARGQVIAACRNLGIPVDVTCPDPSERDTWRGAFLTNSIRRVQNLDGIICAATNVWGHDAWGVTFRGDNPIVRRIAERIIT